MSPSRIASVVSVLSLIVLFACSEEDRRAWVSVLPGGDHAEPEVAHAAAGEIAITPDSAAVLLGADTLFTALRSGVVNPDGTPARFTRVAISPDSAHIAFATAGPTARVGVWSRVAQSAEPVTASDGGAVDTLAWSGSGRYLAHQVRSETGRTLVGVYDVAGLRVRHPVVEWLDRHERSVMLQDWIGRDQVRLLVAPGAEPSGGLAYLWDAANGVFAVEAHIDVFPDHAPQGVALERDGVFSIDVVGDAAPETVALYRRSDASLGAFVLESRGDAYRGHVTESLIDVEVLGFDTWRDARGEIRLHLIADIDGRPLIVLRLPSSQPPLLALGLFRVDRSGRLTMVSAMTPDGELPALFYDGRQGGASSELGLVDLDEDGEPEIVAASARIQGRPGAEEIAWRATVFRWRRDRIVPAPDLVDAALARIEQVTRQRFEER